MVPRISEILKKLYINNSIKKFIEKKLIQKDKICYTLFYKLTFSKTMCNNNRPIQNTFCVFVLLKYYIRFC